MAKIFGTSGDDNLTGTDESEAFVLVQGGNDKASGEGGNDHFRLDATMDASDFIDGGDGDDTLILEGDYAANLALDSSVIQNVERLRLLGDFDYNLTIANSAFFGRLALHAEQVHRLSVDASGSFSFEGGIDVYSGAGDDVIIGPSGADQFFLGVGGVDVIDGGEGSDSFYLGGAMTADDQLNGGLSLDRLFLDGDYSGANALVLTGTTMQNIEQLYLGRGHNYDITSSGATSFSNRVDARSLRHGDSAQVDASAETTTQIHIEGGAGNDTFAGGALRDDIYGHGGKDVIRGGGGGDFLIGAQGHDTYVYLTPDESGANGVDFVDFAASEDFIDVPVEVDAVGLVSHIVRSSKFFEDIADAVGNTLDATVVTADGGSLKGHIYLVIDGNGDSAYTPQDDWVIDITNYRDTITPDNFV